MSDSSFEPKEAEPVELTDSKGEELTETQGSEAPSTEFIKPTQVAPSDKPIGDPSVGLPSGMNVITAPPLPLQRAMPGAKGPWVKYVGVATLRIMRGRDWRNVGADSNDYVEWNALNGKRQPVSRFDDTQLNYLLHIDGRFELDESA